MRRNFCSNCALWACWRNKKIPVPESYRFGGAGSGGITFCHALCDAHGAAGEAAVTGDDGDGEADNE